MRDLTWVWRYDELVMLNEGLGLGGTVVANFTWHPLAEAWTRTARNARARTGAEPPS